MIGRRELTAGAIVTVVASFAAQAQQRKTYRVALVNVGRTNEEMIETGHPLYRLFLGELRKLGFVEGENLVVLRRSALGVAESHYAEFAQAVVAESPDLIVTNSSRLVLAFQAATRRISIMMLAAADPVAWGLVDQLNHPGGNVTGMANDAGVDEPTVWGHSLNSNVR